MVEVVITHPGERVVEEFQALVARPTSPSSAPPPAIGLVEISQSQPTQLIPGPVGPQGPPGADSTVPGPVGPQGPQGSPDTAAQVLAKLVTVDGTGSNLDADLLDGQTGSYYTTMANQTGTISSAQHGNLPGGALHAAATAAAAGFMTDAPSDGVSYGRKNAAWATIVGGAVISDTAPPGPLQAGQLWWKSDTGNTYIWYNDGDSQQWVQQNVAIVPANVVTLTAETRNRIVNGAMQISQENGTTEAAAHLYYTADQWTGQQSTSGTILAGRDAVSTPNRSVYRLHSRITVADTSLAAGDYYMPFMQWIEGIRLADFGWGAASGPPVVVRFGFRGPAGSYACTLRSGATDATYVHPFTIAAGDANTDISVGFSVPAPTIGTWATDSGRGMMFSICCAAGSTWQAPSTDTWVAGSFMGHASLSNGMAVAGNVFHIFDVGLHLDPLNTGIAPPWQQPDEAAELRACMRYFQTGTLRSRWTAAAAGNTDARYYPLPIVLRSVPATMTTNVTANINVSSATVAANVAGGNVIHHNVTATAAGAVDHTAGWTASARM